MTIAVVAWIEIFVALALRWLVLNERLERTVQARGSHPYLSRDELTDLLVDDPKTFARVASREWLKGVSARTQASSDPDIERRRMSGNRGYVVLLAYLFLGTPLLGLVTVVIASISWMLLVTMLLALQVLLLGYWLQRLREGRRHAEGVAVVAAIGGIAAVLVATVVGAILAMSGPAT